MESVAFGWAVGDIIAVVRTIHNLVSLFRGARGAHENFTINAAWLESFARDLQRIHEFMGQNPNAPCRPGLQEKLLLISVGYTKFERYLDRFDVFLPQPIPVEGVCSKRWRMVKRVKKSVQWSWKDLNGQLDDLKLAVSMPLAEMNLILLLDLCSDFQGMNQRIESLPTASDVAEIKTMIEAQLQHMIELAKTTGEIRGAFWDSAKTFAIESTVEDEAGTAMSRSQARLASIAGHLEEHASGDGILLSSRENQKIAHEQCYYDIERSASLFDRYERIVGEITTLVLSALQKLEKLEEEVIIINELKEGVMQNQKEIEELKKEASEGKSERGKESMRQVLHTGVSIAATATTVAVIFSGLLQKRWEMAININTASTSDSERARFEAKWLSIRRPMVGAELRSDDAKKYNKEESPVDWSPRKLRDLRESTPIDEEVPDHEKMEVEIHTSPNVPITSSNYHLNKE